MCQMRESRGRLPPIGQRLHLAGKGTDGEAALIMRFSSSDRRAACWLGVIGDDIVRIEITPWMHEYSLAALACTCSSFKGLSNAEAATRIRRRGYGLIQAGTAAATAGIQAGTPAATAGILARLEVVEERARALRLRFAEELIPQRLVADMITLLTTLYGLDENVLSRPGSILEVLIREKPTRAWLLHLLPALGEAYCKRHIEDVRVATHDPDANIRSAAVRRRHRTRNKTLLQSHAHCCSRSKLELSCIAAHRSARGDAPALW